MVTSLNEDNESVTVEWIENGDTKGKEVKPPFTAIYCLLKHHYQQQHVLLCFSTINNTSKGNLELL